MGWVGWDGMGWGKGGRGMHGGPGWGALPPLQHRLREGVAPLGRKTGAQGWWGSAAHLERGDLELGHQLRRHDARRLREGAGGGRR